MTLHKLIPRFAATLALLLLAMPSNAEVRTQVPGRWIGPNGWVTFEGTVVAVRDDGVFYVAVERPAEPEGVIIAARLWATRIAPGDLYMLIRGRDLECRNVYQGEDFISVECRFDLSGEAWRECLLVEDRDMRQVCDQAFGGVFSTAQAWGIAERHCDEIDLQYVSSAVRRGQLSNSYEPVCR